MVVGGAGVAAEAEEEQGAVVFGRPAEFLAELLVACYAGRGGGGTYGWGVAGFAAGLLLVRHGGLVLGVVVVVVVEFECGFVLCGCVVIVGEEGTKVGDDRQIREKVGKILLEGRRIQDYVT